MWKEEQLIHQLVRMIWFKLIEQTKRERGRPKLIMGKVNGCSNYISLGSIVNWQS